VVDDSENFALLDQQAAYQRPVSKLSSYGNEEETPLATDNANTASTNNATLLTKVQGLQQEIQELRGQLEVQAHDLKLLQQQQLAFYKDLDARLRHEPGNNPTPTPSADLNLSDPGTTKAPNNTSTTQPVVTLPVNNTSRINPADEQISYLAAYQLVKNKKYDDALVAMQTFVSKYPQGGYTANAQYWLGELYLVKKDYPAAITHFETVLQQFPTSNKSAASQLKIGYALAAAGKKEEAIARLQKVISDYPNTNTAQLAKTKLESLNR
jgi:tol-pal system protein YbgF